MISSALLKNNFTSLVTCIYSSKESAASFVLPAEHCKTDSLVFTQDEKKLQLALQNKASIIVINKDALAKISIDFSQYESCIFQANNLQLAMAEIMILFDGKMNRFNQQSRIHASAVIHPTAKLAHGCLIGPHVVIGEHCTIGVDVTVGANSVIESYCQIGDHTLIHPLVFVGAFTQIGQHCEIHPHTTLGADGFGFIPNKGRPIKIPQIGNVLIGDHVELGAHCTVDRATMMTTSIGSGTKLDDHVHVGHNSQIGKNGLIAGGVIIAGSVKIGDHFICGGQTAIREHLQITDHVMLAAKSGVMNHILEPGQYGGYPLEKFRDHLRTLASAPKVKELEKNIKQIKIHLGLES
ncbi:MAG: UDP-3-O-(3-hydroxymyristoyl)glucosamine N-acyltransferase [Pseudobdellovibrionaceae bacterium]